MQPIFSQTRKASPKLGRILFPVVVMRVQAALAGQLWRSSAAKRSQANWAS
jgi:hypothetical protein